MWEQFGRRSAKRDDAVKSRLGALKNVKGRFGRQEPEQLQRSYSRAAGLKVGALTVLATVLILLVLRRRARRQDNSTEEEVNEEASAESGESVE